MAELGENMHEVGMSGHENLLRGGAGSPLGRAILSGIHRAGQGVGSRWRVYGSYAVVAVTGGTGLYRDTNGLRLELVPGDIVFVFPELAHWYGPRRGETWDEIYLTFDGPAFDLWRTAGILDSTRPVRRLGRQGLVFAGRLEAWVRRFAGLGDDSTRVRQMTELLTLLNEPLLAHDALGVDSGRGMDWYARARSLLETDLGRTSAVADVTMAGVAEMVGMHYETFRKRFQHAAGVSPARYRTLRRIEAAKHLLRFSPQMTNRQIAETLGFADEYHFSRRFSEIAGVSPRAFRQHRPDG
jgi:AraC-like DNA-binding protein